MTFPAKAIRITPRHSQIKNQKKIAIIGAGPGGLCSAMLLASAGHKVTVYEKESTIGGRNAQLTLNHQNHEYKFDVGPTFLMMKFLLDDIFSSAGFRTEDFLDCRPLSPMYRLNFPNFQGKPFHIYGEPEKMKAEIAKFFPGEETGLQRFYDRESQRFQYLYPCLKKDYSTLRSYASWSLLQALPHIALGRSLYEVLGDYFNSEQLKLAFTFQAKYLGMSPWECPGLFAMIPHVEHAHGVYHVMGGLSEISAAFAKAAQQKGARIVTNAPVKQILVENHKAQGVLNHLGQKEIYDEVIINADFGYAMNTLFPKGILKKYSPEKVAKKKYSCSVFMMYLGVDREYQADHHEIIFANRYDQNIRDITEHRVNVDDISVYIRNPNALDKSVAPKGHSALYILSPVSNTKSNTDWSQLAPIYRKKVLEILASRSIYKDLEKHIVAEKIITPQDWENRSVYQGATFNLGHGLDQMLYLRPHNKFEEVDNCYLVGGGTHPGSGLPTIFESARISSKLIDPSIQ